MDHDRDPKDNIRGPLAKFTFSQEIITKVISMMTLMYYKSELQKWPANSYVVSYKD